MNNCVLFTCVGTTDPIRNDFDGSMLHIVRYYRPHTVYILFSKEMEERELEDSRFSRSIELLAHHLGIQVKVEKFFSGIVNAHDFDAYIEIFRDCMEKIKRNHPQDTILLNLSSGTPQMKSMMCLEVVVSTRKLVPVQVSTPNKKSNESRVVGTDYDVEHEFANNLDNEPEAENRCSEPDIMSFRRTLAKGQLISLISTYNYTAAKMFAENYYPSVSKTVLSLLCHLIHRLNLEDSLAIKAVAGIEGMDFYPVKNVECRKMCEYCNILKIYQSTGDLAGFILRLNPFIVRLQGKFIKEGLGFDIDRIIEKYEDEGEEVNLHKFKAVDPVMVDYISKNFYNNRLWEYSPLNIRIQNAIIQYKLKDTNNSMLEHYCKFFQSMERLNQRYRNPLAHDLCGVNEEDIKECSGMSSRQIVKKLESLIKHLYGNHCKPEIFDIYEKINEKIIHELEKSP